MEIKMFNIRKKN